MPVQLLHGGVSQVGVTNDVWASLEGEMWVWVAGTVTNDLHPIYPNTFPPVYESGHCQDLNFRQYRAGGRSADEMSNDVWMSTDGQRWNQQADAAEFEPVYYPSMASDTSGYVYLAGGILQLNSSPRYSSREVWRSTDLGRNWRLMSSGYNHRTGMPMGPAARAVSALIATPSNALLYMTGVNTETSINNSPDSYFEDVWASTNQGRTFDPINLNTQFGRRDDTRVDITSSGIVAMAGGYGGWPGNLWPSIIYTDVWASVNGGYTWSGMHYRMGFSTGAAFCTI